MTFNNKYKDVEPYITLIRDILYKFICPYCFKQNIYINKTQALYNSHQHILHCSKRPKQTKLKENKE